MSHCIFFSGNSGSGGERGGGEEENKIAYASFLLQKHRNIGFFSVSERNKKKIYCIDIWWPYPKRDTGVLDMYFSACVLLKGRRAVRHKKHV